MECDLLLVRRFVRQCTRPMLGARAVVVARDTGD